MSALIIFVIFSLFMALQVCNGNEEKSTTTKTRTNENVTSMYFRHQPYGKGTYAFGYEVNDKETKNRQFHDERRYMNGSVEGSFGYVRPDKKLTITHYIADSKHGYVSQTFTVDEGSNLNASRIKFELPKLVSEEESNLNKTQETGDVTEELPTIEVNRIDLVDDLIEPTLSDLVNGKIPQLANEKPTAENTKVEVKTFQKAIPNDFPIVPFKIPESANEMEKNRTETKISIDQTEIQSEKGEEDWISKIVEGERKEFLGDVKSK